MTPRGRSKFSNRVCMNVQVNDPIAAWLDRLREWVRLHPVAGSTGHRHLADEIADALLRCGLSVTRHPHVSGDLLVARGTGAGPLVGIYGHYDVEPGGPTELQVTDRRVFGRGVADNLGPLAMRLSVLERFKGRPNLLWVIEPGEESGSHALASWVAKADASKAGIWIDETGYFDDENTQRFLAARLSPMARDVLRRCKELAVASGKRARVEERHLRRVVSTAGFHVGCLFQDSPYLALGPNDDRSDVHGEAESLPLETLDISMSQFDLLLDTSSREGCL